MKKTTPEKIVVPLSDDERTALAGAEEIILQHDRATAGEIGRSLAAIRDGRLYRASFPTFEKYVAKRFDLRRARAYQLIRFAEIVALVSTVVDIVPTNERQIRPLLKLKDEQIALAWTEAVNSLPIDAAMTGKHVERTVARLFGRSIKTRARAKAPREKAPILWPGPAELAAQIANEKGPHYFIELIFCLNHTPPPKRNRKGWSKYKTPVTAEQIRLAIEAADDAFWAEVEAADPAFWEGWDDPGPQSAAVSA